MRMGEIAELNTFLAVARESSFSRSDTGLALPRDRRPTIDAGTRSSLEINDDDIDIPPFLK